MIKESTKKIEELKKIAKKYQETIKSIRYIGSIVFPSLEEQIQTLIIDYDQEEKNKSGDWKSFSLSLLTDCHHYRYRKSNAGRLNLKNEYCLSQLPIVTRNNYDSIFDCFNPDDKYWHIKCPYEYLKKNELKSDQTIIRLKHEDRHYIPLIHNGIKGMKNWIEQKYQFEANNVYHFLFRAKKNVHGQMPINRKEKIQIIKNIQAFYYESDTKIDREQICKLEVHELETANGAEYYLPDAAEYDHALFPSSLSDYNFNDLADFAWFYKAFSPFQNIDTDKKDAPKNLRLFLEFIDQIKN